MKSTKLPPIVGPLLATVLLCTGFWLYTEWDLKKFEESFPKVPSVQSAKSETAPAQQGVLREEKLETTGSPQTVSPMPDTDFETSGSIDAEHAFDDSAVAEAATDALALESFFDTFLEEPSADTITSGDFTDVSEAVPYDMERVKAGFDDYNASLKTDPEYAYQRLDDAFREQYGDDPDVDILVEHIRESNEGTTEIAEAIDFVEAVIRLTSKVSPPEALESLYAHLEFLRETQHMALEQGTAVQHQNAIHVGE